MDNLYQNSITTPNYEPWRRPRTHRARILKMFKNGKGITVHQMLTKFGVMNPTATISSMRKYGWGIYKLGRKYYLDSYQEVPHKFVQAA